MTIVGSRRTSVQTKGRTPSVPSRWTEKTGAPRPDWMSDPKKLPTAPPGRSPRKASER